MAKVRGNWPGWKVMTSAGFVGTSDSRTTHSEISPTSTACAGSGRPSLAPPHDPNARADTDTRRTCTLCGDAARGQAYEDAMQLPIVENGEVAAHQCIVPHSTGS